MRTICSKGPRHSCRQLFKDLKILTVVSIYILNCAVYIKTNINSFITTNDAQNRYALRKGDHLRVPPHRLTLTTNSSVTVPIKIYNHLPSNLKELTHIESFKKRLKNALVQQSFYSLNEYFASTL